MKAIDTIHLDDAHYAVVIVPPNSVGHQEVITIRSQGSKGIFSDNYDETADIYLMKRGDTPIATMRVNQARRGSMDCEEFYPKDFLSRYRHMIGSASRLARSVSQKPNVHLMRRFVRSVWRHQLSEGIRVDLINVHQRMIPYYADMGYKLLCNSFFWHPRINTPSHVMFMIASKDTKSPLSEVFAPHDDPLLVELASAQVPVCWNPTCLTRTHEDMMSCSRFSCHCRDNIV